MGFWTNASAKPKAEKRVKRSKADDVDDSTAPRPAQGSTWTQGRQTGAHAASILMIAAMVCGPAALGIQLLRPAQAPQAAAVTTSTGLTTSEQAAGSYALAFVGAWLTATKDVPGELATFIDLKAIRTYSEVAGQYRDLTVAGIDVPEQGAMLTVTIAANVKELTANPKAEGEAIESWPRRYFQVAVSLDEATGAMRVVGLPVPVSAPQQTKPVQLGYTTPLAPSDAVSETVLAFIQAYATGAGELGRYVSPGAEIEAIAPAPFLAVTAEDIRSDVTPEAKPADGATVHVLATVQFVTRLDQTLTSTYALTLTARADRWEISSIDPVPLQAPGSQPTPTTSSEPTTPSPSPTK